MKTFLLLMALYTLYKLLNTSLNEGLMKTPHTVCGFSSSSRHLSHKTLKARAQLLSSPRHVYFVLLHKTMAPLQSYFVRVLFSPRSGSIRVPDRGVC